MNTEIVKRETEKHHNVLENISELKHYKNESRNFLKRLDKDIDILFTDLGKANERSKANTGILLLSLRKNSNETENEIKNTNEKIRDNMLMIENYYKNLNSRIIAARKIVDENTKNIRKNKVKIEFAQMFLNSHLRNVSKTET